MWIFSGITHYCPCPIHSNIQNYLASSVTNALKRFNWLDLSLGGYSHLSSKWYLYETETSIRQTLLVGSHSTFLIGFTILKHSIRRRTVFLGHENKGLFRFRMRNEILRRSKKSKRGQRRITCSLSNTSSRSVLFHYHAKAVIRGK